MSSDASSIGRVLSIPSTPRSNNGRDNANDDLILREGEELGECVGSRVADERVHQSGAKWRKGRRAP